MTGISIYAIISEILADNALRRRLGRSTPGLLTPDNREALAVTARAAAAQTAASAAPYITVVSDDGEIITIDTPESLSDAERGLTARLITHAAVSPDTGRAICRQRSGDGRLLHTVGRGERIGHARHA